MKAMSFIAVLCLLFASGCDSNASNAQNATDASPEASSTSTTTAAATDDDSDNLLDSPAFIQKYNHYIGFVNRFNNSVSATYNRYTSWVDVDKGPNDDGIVYGLYNIDGKDQLDKLKAAIESQPKIEKVDDLMSRLHEKASHLNEIVADAEKYYDRENYKDDNFAKGKELHPLLTAAFDDYFNALSELSTELSSLNDQLFLHEAEKFKNAGRLIRYNMMMTLNEAEKIITVLHEAENLSTVDLDQFNDKVSGFNTAFDALEEAAKNEAEIKQEFGHNGHNFDRFIDYCVELVKESRNLRERVESKNYEYSITHPSIPDSGSPLKLFKTYDGMVGSYNSLSS